MSRQYNLKVGLKPPKNKNFEIRSTWKTKYSDKKMFNRKCKKTQEGFN